MPRPVLVAVDDDPTALGVLRQELGKRYGADHRVVCDGNAAAGLRGLEQLRADGGQVALVLADQWMPAMTGVEFLARAHGLHPTAQRALLIDWGDRSTAEPILQAAAFGQIDDWIAKPSQPGDERFHQAISGFLYEWARLQRPRFQAVRVVGDQWSARSHELRDLLGRNRIPFGFYPVDSQQGQRLLGSVDATRERLPVAVVFDGRVSLPTRPTPRSPRHSGFGRTRRPPPTTSPWWHCCIWAKGMADESPSGASAHMEVW